LAQTQSSLTGQDLEEGKWMSGRSDRRATGKDIKGRGLERTKNKTTGVLPEG